MPEIRPHSFGYAHSTAVMAGLKACAEQRYSRIDEGYGFIDVPGEYSAFQKMLEVARQGGRDILYIDSVKELAGASLAEFKANLQAVQKAGMTVYSLTERDYDYSAFLTAIEVLEDLTPMYLKSPLKIRAITMWDMGAEVADICKRLEMSEAEVYEAIAAYKRGQEQPEQLDQIDE